MQKLTLEQVKKNARKFYAKGKLTAQHPDPKKRECEYAIGDCRCAIGASLTKATLAKINDAGCMTLNVVVLERKDIVELAEDGKSIMRIQFAHDAWASASRRGFQEHAKHERDFFLKLIDFKEE